MPKRPTKASTKPAAEEVEDLDVEDVEVEETDEDVDADLDDLEVEDAEPEEQPAPAKKARAKKEKAEKPAREEIKFGSAWLAEHVNEACGTDYDAFQIRTLLRGLVKKGLFEREVGTDRSRYSFSGPGDPAVKAVIKAVKSGELEKEKKEKLAALKEQKAAKKAAAAAEEKPAKKSRAKSQSAPEPEDDDSEDIEDL